MSGEDTTLAGHAGKVLLVVNVASRCGNTPQYTGLERLHEKYADQGFSVLGFPSNQFDGQEPGTAQEIAEFCSATYGVTFPLYEKTDVNGDQRHPVYAELVETPDTDGVAGDVEWNFEKFLVGRDGAVLARFRPDVEPDDSAVVTAIETALAADAR
ncbi:MAG TPA: glutathione peroxidase [Nocardioidaceae bacterium]|nr:glutathione peroxidase [Nocardioidaceae bacterium]